MGVWVWSHTKIKNKKNKPRAEQEPRSAHGRAVNDMSVAQQHAKFQSEKEKIKNEQLKVVAEGRGRKLKFEEFPELAQYFEIAFREGDRVLSGGGGL